MSIDYTLSMATGLIVKLEDLPLLSFLAVRVDENPEIFFGPDVNIGECEEIVDRALTQIFGSDIVADRSHDQWDDSFEEAIVLYAPSTHRNLSMRGGNSFTAFAVSGEPAPSQEESKALGKLASDLGLDPDAVSPIIWGSIL